MKNLGLYLLPLLLLVGCSKVGLGYSLGTSQIRNRVDDAFGFSPRSKSKDVDHFLSSEFDTNKKIFFEKLRSMMLKVQVLTDKDQITVEEGDKLYKETLQFQKEVILLFKPSFDKVFKEVSDAEVKVFKDYSAEQISEKEEEAADRKNFKKKKIANFTRVAEFFLGDFSRDQQKLMDNFFDDHLSFYAEQVQMRKSFNADLIKLYPEKVKMVDLSLAYYSGDNSIRSEGYRKQREIFELDFKNLILGIWAIRSAEQKNFFQQRLKDLLKEVDKALID